MVLHTLSSMSAKVQYSAYMMNEYGALHIYRNFPINATTSYISYVTAVFHRLVLHHLAQN